MIDQSALVTATVIIACIALIVGIGGVLYAGARITGVRPRQRSPLGGVTVLVLTGWLAVTVGLASAGLYVNEIWLGLGLAVPLVSGVLALYLPSVAASLKDSRAVALLAAVQIVRLVGGVFLVQLDLHRLPPGFALPAGIGDVLVGLLAPFVAYALWRRPQRRALGVAFNALGLVDLVVAIPLGVLHAPGRLQFIVTEPTTEIMGLLPMTLIPTFVVPLAIVLHIASFRLLIRSRGEGGANVITATHETAR